MRQKMQWKIVLIAAVFGFVVIGVVFNMKRSGEPDKIFSDGDIVLVKIGQTEVRAELAMSQEAQARGLSGRDRMEENSGMLFVFSESAPRKFWMRGMKFSIDIIWIRDGEVIDWVAGALPPGLTQGEAQEFLSPEPVDMVLEVPAGFAAQNQIVAGEEVTIKQ